ncbi:MAG: chromate efflux transporter, partial [Sandarakinorhabdus sp.]|nr:chromate efflux transporter [Sandarakinorhabdus sp.]
MAQSHVPAKADAFVRSFARIGVFSLGGPAGQIAVLHAELVEKRQWIDDAAFLRALNFCMLLPGPEAQQLATWCGWKLRGLRGGLVAGLLFIAPGALVMAALALLYLHFGRLAGVQAAFGGAQAAVVAIVALGVLRVARRTLKNWRDWAFAAAALLASGVGVPFPLVIAGALIGGSVFGTAPAAAPATGPEATGAPPADWRSSLRVAAIGLLLWLVPLAVLAAALGRHHPLVDLGGFFARLAAVSFGGAYAGLAYVAQGAAVAHGWVTPTEIIDGLALAETTPGPLVLVYQFVGGLAGHRIVGGTFGALAGMALVLWMTFVPSFLLVLSLAPHLEHLLAKPGLARALQGVTAAVVGIMAGLGLWFATHVLLPEGQP